MRLGRFAPALPIMLGAIVALLCFLQLAGVVRAADLSPFLDLDAGACDRLDDRNLQVGPPDAEIVAACAVLRRGAILGQRFSGGPGASALALLGLVGVYAILGAPLRSVFGLIGRSAGRSVAVLSIETVLALCLRSGVGLLVLAILSLPFTTAGGCVAMLVMLVLSLRPPRADPTGIGTAPPPSPWSVVLADLINDIAASAAGIVGLALLVRRDPWWLGAGLALALVASVPAVISARRRVRRDPTTRLAATAVLGAMFGAAALADPDLAEAFGDTLAPVLVSALVFALVVIAVGWMGLAEPRSDARAADRRG